MKKAVTIEDIYSVFDHATFLQKADVDFYVNLYEEHTQDFVNTLILNRVPSKTFFIAGQSGNGKSTMLNMLTTSYPELSEKYEFHYIAGRSVFLYEDIDIIDVLLMVGSKLVEGNEKIKEQYFKKLQKLKDIKTGVYEESESVLGKSDEALSAKAKISVGAKFFSIFGASADFESSYKINEEIRKDARRFFKIQRSELIKLTNEIITSYKAEKNDGKELIIVIDDLEKKENIDELFLKDMPLLNELNLVKIVAMPIHLSRNNTIHSGEVIEFALKLKTYKGETNSSDTKLLKETIERRLSKQELIAEEAKELAIKYSGANVRQLIRLINYAALKAYGLKAPIITEKEIKDAIEKLGRDFSPQVMNMTTFLNEIKTNKQYTEDNEENQKKIAKATKSELVFAYFNGTVWYDINPVIEKALEQYSR